MQIKDRIFAQYKANKDNDSNIWIRLARQWKMSCRTIKNIVRDMKPNAPPLVVKAPLEPFQNKLTRMLTKLRFKQDGLTYKPIQRNDSDVIGMIFAHPEYPGVRIAVFRDKTWQCELKPMYQCSAIIEPFQSKEYVRSILEPSILNPLFRSSKISKLLSYK